MRKIYLSIAAIAVVLSLTTLKMNAQTTLYTQNFDGNGTSLPLGWTSTSAGWSMDSVTANRSTGYPGASGLFNCKISNVLDTVATKNLTTNSMSTSTDTGITVMWAARRTTHFSDSASSIAFEFSINNGTTWTNVPYTENAGNSTWALDNAAVRIALPASANHQASLMFRWVASLHSTPSGTYRIDDFNVEGTIATGITEYQNNNLINMFMDNNNTLHLINESTPEANISSLLTVIDVTGRICMNEKLNNINTEVMLPVLSTGIYFATITNANGRFTKKLFITSNK